MPHARRAARSGCRCALTRRRRRHRRRRRRAGLVALVATRPASPRAARAHAPAGHPRIGRRRRASLSFHPARSLRPSASAARATSACSSSSGWWRRSRAPRGPRAAAQDRERTCASSSAPTAPARSQLDRADCWDQFLFSKTLRRTRRCIQLNAEVESARQRLADLDRAAPPDHGHAATARSRTTSSASSPATAAGSSTRRRPASATQRRNPFALLFGGEEREPTARRGPTNQFGNLPFATYRTLCVRLCDGYYFPVSFSTLPNHFQRDVRAVPVAVRGPGRALLPPEPRRRGRAGGVGRHPAALHQPEVAFRYRKEYVQGCSCKQAEFNPTLDKKAAELAPQTPVLPAAPGLRAAAKK